MYIYAQQCRNSVYMKFSPQATLKWAAQRMHSKVIRLVMHNTNMQALKVNKESASVQHAKSVVATVVNFKCCF